MKNCFATAKAFLLTILSVFVLLELSAYATTVEKETNGTDLLVPDAKKTAENNKEDMEEGKKDDCKKCKEECKGNKQCEGKCDGNCIACYYNDKIDASVIIDNIIKGNDILIKNCTIEGDLDFSSIDDKLKIASNEFLTRELEEKCSKSKDEINIITMKEDCVKGFHIKNVQRNYSSNNVNVIQIKSKIEISANSIFKGGIKCNGKKDEVNVVIFEEKVDIYDSTIEGQVDFKNALFLKDAWFNKSIFKKTADFKNAYFRDYINFRESKFYKKPDFNDTQLSGPYHRSAFIVNDAISLKKKNLDKRYIIDYLYEKHEKNANPFGRVDLEANQVAELYEAGFDEDFVRRMQGIPPIVTITPAAIYLEESKQVAGALILSLSLIPKNICEYGYRNLKVNLGVSSSTQEKKENSPTNEKVNTEYYLVGLSWKFNRYSLLNAGLAVPDVDEDIEVGNQFYIGITVDKDLLDIFK